MENRHGERVASGAKAGPAKPATKAVVLLSPFSGEITLPKLPKGRPPVKKPSSPPRLNGEILEPPHPKPPKPTNVLLPPRELPTTVSRLPEYDIRARELERALFPPTQQAPGAASPKLLTSGRSSPAPEAEQAPESPEPGRLPRLHILESLNALQKGAGYSSVHTTKLFVRSPGIYAPGVDVPPEDPTNSDEYYDRAGFFLPVVFEGHGGRAEALALERWLEKHWRLAINKLPEGPPPGVVLGGHGGPLHPIDATQSGDPFRDRAVSPLTGEPSGAPFYNAYGLPVPSGRQRMPRISAIDNPNPGGGEHNSRRVSAVGDAGAGGGGGGGGGAGPHEGRRRLSMSHMSHGVAGEASASSAAAAATGGAAAAAAAAAGGMRHPRSSTNILSQDSHMPGGGGGGGGGGAQRQPRTSASHGYGGYGDESVYGGGAGGGGRRRYSVNRGTNRPTTPDSGDGDAGGGGGGGGGRSEKGGQGHFKPHVQASPGFHEKLRVLSLTVAELCRQEAVTSGERARILCRSWNDAVKTYDEELRRLRLRASLAEEMAHSCAAHRQAAMRAQKTAERDARAVRKAMLGMAMEEEEPAKLRMRIKELEDLERSYQELLAAAVHYMERGTANYLWQRTRRAVEAEVTERLEREMFLAAELMRRQTISEMGAPGAYATAAAAAAAAAGKEKEKGGADWSSVRGMTQADLSGVLENPAMLLEVMHTFELAVEQAGALRGASAEQRRVKEAETYKSVQGGGILTALGKMQAFAHDPAVAALVASGLDLDSAKLARVTAERLSRFSGAALRDELGELLRRAPGGAAAALLTMTDRMQRRCLRELRPDQLVKLVHALDVDQQASVLEMADSAEAGAALASMDPWEAAQPLERMPEWAAATILRSMEAVSCSAIMRNLRAAPVAMILSRLTIAVAAEHFQTLDEDLAAQAFFTMPIQFANSLTTELGPSYVAANILKLASVKQRRGFLAELAKTDTLQLQNVMIAWDPANGFKEALILIEKVRNIGGAADGADVMDNDDLDETRKADGRQAEAAQPEVADDSPGDEGEEEDEEEEEDEFEDDGTVGTSVLDGDED